MTNLSLKHINSTILTILLSSIAYYTNSWIPLTYIPTLILFYYLLNSISKSRKWIKTIINTIKYSSLVLVLYIIGKIYFFDIYHIPTGSMEGTILPGDRLFVSKWHYGTRHFTDEGTLDHYAGTSNISRGDVFVFNYPVEDSSYVYPEAGAGALAEKLTKEPIPIPSKTAYLKRCIALPGDTLRINEGIVYINNEEQPLPHEAKQKYRLQFKNRESMLSSLKEFKGARVYNQDFRNLEAFAYFSKDEVTQLPDSFFEEPPTRTWDDSTTRSLYGNRRSLDNWENVIIPFEGQQVSLDTSNIEQFRSIITKYENHNLIISSDSIFIDGKHAEFYTIQKNYFFAMGDNRYHSIDSRFWGFVPKDHIVGKALFVLFSTKPYSRGWDGVRWERSFSGIN